MSHHFDSPTPAAAQTRRGNLFLIAGLLCSLPIAWALPVDWGWENGPIENTQALILLLGLCTALWATAHQPQHDKALWRIAALLWLGMAAHELAWGAAFTTPMQWDPRTGPAVSSDALWYTPAVPWVVGAMLLGALYTTRRRKLLARVVWRWLREGAMPWSTLGLCVLCMVVSTQADSLGAAGLPTALEGSHMVVKEMAQLWAYLALWWAQWVLIGHGNVRARYLP